MDLCPKGQNAFLACTARALAQETSDVWGVRRFDIALKSARESTGRSTRLYVKPAVRHKKSLRVGKPKPPGNRRGLSLPSMIWGKTEVSWYTTVGSRRQISHRRCGVCRITFPTWLTCRRIICLDPFCNQESLIFKSGFPSNSGIPCPPEIADVNQLFIFSSCNPKFPRTATATAIAASNEVEYGSAANPAIGFTSWNLYVFKKRCQ